MSKLYILAIGGSGSRVLRSLTMLFANGVGCNSEVVPMIIDPDTSNGDLNRTVDLLRLYQSIHSELDFNDNVKNKFFKTHISAFNGADFLLSLDGTAGITFEQYLGVSTMSKENQALMKMLFSEANLASDMNVGFKGNPNIGSVVLNQFTQSTNFRAFENDFVQGDKVFIVSSIFGGTGASGFPLLLKTIRTSNNTALKDAPIGAVTLLPYFNLKDNQNSSIKADSFLTKAKAALNYYERNVTGNNTLNDMYYLGDDFTAAGYENSDGGDSQINPAHFVEMLAALAIIDFDHKTFTLPISTRFHEFGLNDNPSNSITFTNLGNKTISLIRKPMSQFAFWMSYLSNRDRTHRISQRWARERKELLGDAFFSSDAYSDIASFKKEYDSWISEMGDNHVSFKPFKDNRNVTDVLELVDGLKPKYGIGFFEKKGYDLMDKVLGNRISDVQQNSGALQTFVEIFFMTTNDLCTEKLKM